MSNLRRKLKNKKPPEGWELIEDVVEDFEQQMKDAVNEEHEGKRKAELTWKIHRIHWEKNRFIFDLMYQRKVMARELFDYLVREKIADGALISKWRKPGYELLCSLMSIQRSNHNFGTTAHCRVPLRLRAGQQRITPNVQTGCISCASGDGKFGGPCWWNTPLEDEEAETADENRTTWTQAGAGAGGSGGRNNVPTRRPRDEFEEEDEIPDEVNKRLQLLKGSGVAAPKPV